MNLEELLQRAVYLARSGDADRAIPLFVRLVEKRPENVQLRVFLAKALGLAFRYEERDLLIDNLLVASKRDPQVVVELAKTWEELDRPDLALGLWEEAAGSGRVPGSWSQVARLAERLNRLEQAGEALERGRLEGEPGPCWMWVQARLAQRAGRHAEALKLFEDLHRRAGEGEWWRKAGHGLAATCDALGEYRKAWESLGKLKKASLPEAQKMARATPLPGPGELPLSGKAPPDFEEEIPLTLLTGFPRSGTTLTLSLLSRESGQDFTDESLAMDRMLRVARAGRSSRAKGRDLKAARKAYLEATTALLGRDLLNAPFIDKNPAMALWLPWVRRVIPEVRLLWVRRDWREVALSCWFTDFPLNGLTARFADREALAGILELASKHQAHWRETLPTSSYHEVSYEDVVISGSLPEATMTFVGKGQEKAVEVSPGPVEFVNSPTYAEVREAPSKDRLGRWRNYEEFAPDFFEKLAAFGGG